ncbi:MAG: hypothetical protein GKC05_07580 [Methanomicrobiales archaeon]|nr:hypothetical protein [Methanomicrobiales archaeon]NYT21247.1 hypothetical protein [Methanomicrobiales archaeon]
MVIAKGAYLRSITASHHLPSVEVGTTIDGSSPPSIFIGSWNYPKVFAGPMIAPLHGDTRILDMPEAWIPDRRSQEEIISYRMSLVRGKLRQDVRDLDGRFADQLREIALSAGSIASEATFDRVPTGCSLSEEQTPFGPSAEIERLDIESPKWDPDLERVYYDTDLPTADGIVGLHAAGIPFTCIQKALSAGTMGRGKARKMVPTRWSITACDTTIGDHLLRDVRRHQPIDTVRVHRFSSLHNHYAVILLPTPWQYEWMEAFLHVAGTEELIFSDLEWNRGKREYSRVGGCFYSCRMAVLEALSRERKQAGAIVLREARRGYVPMGVFNVRENVRNALLTPPEYFEDLAGALAAVGPGFQVPVSRFVGESTLLSECLRQKQSRLTDFIPGMEL